MNEDPQMPPTQAPEGTCGCDCAMCAAGQHDQCPTGKCSKKDQGAAVPPAEEA